MSTHNKQAFIENPLAFMRVSFDEHERNGNISFDPYVAVQQKMKELGVTAQDIPDVNNVSIDRLTKNQLVRFRCMVQDTFDLEYYLSQYAVANKQTGETSRRCGFGRETLDIGENEDVVMGSSEQVTSARQVFYCVNIPCETDWACDGFRTAAEMEYVGYPLADYATNGAARALPKRLREETDEDTAVGAEIDTAASKSGDKKPRTEAEAPAEAGPMYTLNLPIPNDKRGMGCLIKFYGDNEEIKVNTLVEFVGILSKDGQQGGEISTSCEDLFTKAEMMAHNPPTVLVPRLHALDARILSHNNPLIPTGQSESLDCSFNDPSALREELVGHITSAMLGDRLAAEYYLCSLMSSVTSRDKGLVVGKMTINFTKARKDDAGSCTRWRRISDLTTMLRPAVQPLRLGLDMLNKHAFVPRKNYDANRIESGLLQVSQGTPLIIDETSMEPGQLKERGIANLKALEALSIFQTVQYDFKYYQVDFPSDRPLTIFSEGASLIKTDITVPLTPPGGVSGDAATFHSIKTKLRVYLEQARAVPYSLNDAAQKMIETDFVRMREEAGKTANGKCAVTGEDLHALLGLGRLVALSLCRKTLDIDCWERAKTMEKERKQRLAHK